MYLCALFGRSGALCAHRRGGCDPPIWGLFVLRPPAALSHRRPQPVVTAPLSGSAVVPVCVKCEET